MEKPYPTEPDPAERLAEMKARLDESMAASKRAREFALRAVELARQQRHQPPQQPSARAQALSDALDETRRAKDALVDLMEAKDRYLMSFAHEIRQAVHASQTAISLCRVRADDRAIHSICDLLDRQMQRIARLVDDVVETARGVMDKLRIERERVDVRDVIHTATRTATGHIEQRGHALVLEGFDEPLWITGDPVRLEQVFTNLLLNAAAYTPDGGRITVSCSTTPNEVLVAVRDTGRGLSPDDMKTIFQPFAQVDTSRGLGVGLALAATIVALHDGSIAVDSDGEGRGSTFTVRLPRAE